ncbi:uncharacterized protein LOC134218243 [Armigeres subalbatus]|uniref:uncharacterized protein LOC134218243 n=1 Tax=Armigeres subalbatus TaxID=124917 RepID=UPI002ED4C711
MCCASKNNIQYLHFYISMKKTTDSDGKGKPIKDKAFRGKNKRKYKRKKSIKHQTKRAYEQGYCETRAADASSSNRKQVPPKQVGPSYPQIKNAQNMWIKTYQNIVKWQFQHQMNYWKQHALLLREENGRLKRRLQVQDSEDEEDEAHAYAEATTWELQQQEEPAADDDALDEEFIAFMEVSARHRLERRRLKNESVH